MEICPVCSTEVPELTQYDDNKMCEPCAQTCYKTDMDALIEHHRIMNRGVNNV